MANNFTMDDWQNEYNSALTLINSTYQELLQHIEIHSLAYEKAYASYTQTLNAIRQRIETDNAILIALAIATLTAVGGKIFSNLVASKVGIRIKVKGITSENLQQKIKEATERSRLISEPIQEGITEVAKQMMTMGMTSAVNAIKSSQTASLQSDPNSAVLPNEIFTLAKINLAGDMQNALKLLYIANENIEKCIKAGFTPKKIANKILSVYFQSKDYSFSDIIKQDIEKSPSLPNKYERVLWWHWAQRYCVAENKAQAASIMGVYIAFWKAKELPKECLRRLSDLKVSKTTIDVNFYPYYDKKTGKRMLTPIVWETILNN